ncbi:hypothetical protein BHU72_14280 [Desulfuribacillus stibiiarsenatis]|uniref:Na/Pi cotransporter n=1 Tax=Desulfuribacillus stibiiarsenatis TaxID=1390249 RepID=A0A1E5L7I1_9FIRM|nr:Na/Pi symporter [Desulfuribacillus stibiiarsenatis]OEH86091.1 hypothetical protein BHU72_14280 [Desulfuribacillus stibiiarsenatis]
MSTFALILGGIGLFLLGMNLMTEGLKALAGESLKNWLSKFTGGTFSSIFSGATITAIIQSSSATTFMTIGFVSAGLLTFTQAIGVIIGANLGSTSTGWIVTIIGFKVNMGAIALPVIGVGILMKLLSSNRLGPQGYALAGFGLIFLGISVLQDGMSDFTNYIDLTRFSGDQWWVMPALVLIGIVMTVVMQSSSAAVVTTLTALHTGVIGLEQAAILVIGQNVGTTIKAYLATLGGTVASKQTATAHILFNLLTGIIALVFLPWLIRLVFVISEAIYIDELATTLALFHTVFNVIGAIAIVLILPWFKAVVLKIFPDEEDTHCQYLHKSLATVGPVGIEAARRALLDLWIDIVDVALSAITNMKVSASKNNKLELLERALVDIQNFLLTVSDSIESKEEYISLVHSIDHIERVLHVMKEEYNPTQAAAKNMNIDHIIRRLTATYQDVEIEEESYNLPEELLEQLAEQSRTIAEIRKEGRKEIYRNAADQQTLLKVDEAIHLVQTIHWLDRLAYHLWRSANHLTRE